MNSYGWEVNNIAKILVVDDEESLVRLITHNLEKEGHKTISASDGLRAWEQIKSDRPDLIILDLMLPGVDGLELCRRLMQAKISVPIIMLTARDDEIDKVVGLELGADDYVTKPFGVRELMARVKALLRRNQAVEVQPELTSINVGPLIIRLDSYEAILHDERLDLTLKEFELLALLVKNKGKVLKREYLLDTLWGYDVETGSRVLDVHISKVRDKVETDSKHPRFIKTVRGIGYKFEGDKYE